MKVIFIMKVILQVSWVGLKTPPDPLLYFENHELEYKLSEGRDYV